MAWVGSEEGLTAAPGPSGEHQLGWESDLEVPEVLATCFLLSTVPFFTLRQAGERWQPAPTPASRRGGQDLGTRGGEKGSSHPVPCQHGPCCAAERVIDKQVSAVKEKCCRALCSRLPDQYPAMAKPAADWIADDGCWGNKSPGINCLGDYYRMRCFAASRCLLKIYIPWVCIGGSSSCAARRFRMVHTPCRCGARGVVVAVAVWGAPGVEERLVPCSFLRPGGERAAGAHSCPGWVLLGFLLFALSLPLLTFSLCFVAFGGGLGWREAVRTSAAPRRGAVCVFSTDLSCQLFAQVLQVNALRAAPEALR